MNVMAFIPARGGSKGIPRKNLTLLNGKPLIQYTVEAAQGSKYITDIFLSSDDYEIIDFCRSLGLSVPYVRPAMFATDEASMIDTVVDALDWLRINRNWIPDSVLLLQPTSPLRRTEDIDQSIELFFSSNSDSLMSVHRMIEHPYECLRLDKAVWTFLAKSLAQAVRRQDYEEEFYYINGAIYIARTEFLLKKKAFFDENKTSLYFMEPIHGVDIDDMFDLKRAEFFLKMCPTKRNDLEVPVYGQNQ